MPGGGRTRRIRKGSVPLAGTQVVFIVTLFAARDRPVLWLLPGLLYVALGTYMILIRDEYARDWDGVGGVRFTWRSSVVLGTMMILCGAAVCALGAFAALGLLQALAFSVGGPAFAELFGKLAGPR